MMASAVLVGAVAAIPSVVVALPTLSLVQALVGGSGLVQAWQAAGGMTDEDWEMVPALLIGAVFIGALIAAISACVWLVIIDRLQGRPRVARVGAALAAAAVPILLLVLPNWPLAVAVALPAGLIALVAAPRVGYGHRNRALAPKASA